MAGGLEVGHSEAARTDPREALHIADLLRLNLGAVPAYAKPLGRGQHRKHHGCVQATFTVRANLPEPLRHGVFAEPASFSAWVRLSNGRVFDDRQADAHGMAIKLLGVPGDKLLPGREHETAQDFVLVDNETFFTGDPADYLRVNRATMSTGWDRLFAWGGLLLRPVLLMRVIRFISKRPRSPLESSYFSTVPFRLGDSVVKYAVCPKRAPDAARLQGPDGLSEALRDTLAKGGAAFEFCVDLQSDVLAHPIEDPTRCWSKAGATRIAVADLIIEPQLVDPCSPLAENLQFSPWHALRAHTPLGFINRARAPIYREMAKTRHARNKVTPLESADAPDGFYRALDPRDRGAGS